MIQKPLSNALIVELMQKIDGSIKRDEIYNYICEVAQNCVNLCRKGQNTRVLNEFKFLIDNLREEFDL